MDLEINEYINIDLDSRNIPLPKSKIIKLSLRYDYYLKFIEIQKSLNLSSNSLIVYLINLYEVINYQHIMQLRRSIMKRVQIGVDYHYLTQMKILYYALGHFLKRIRLI